MLTTPATLVRVEAFAYFVLSILAYRALRGGWVMFALLFLAPDLSNTFLPNTTATHPQASHPAYDITFQKSRARSFSFLVSVQFLLKSFFLREVEVDAVRYPWNSLFTIPI